MRQGGVADSTMNAVEDDKKVTPGFATEPFPFRCEMLPCIFSGE